MDTKEAVEFMLLYRYNHIGEPCQESEGIDGVVALLQQGERYYKIVKEMESVHCGEDGEFGYSRRKLVRKLKQKYFSKE